MVWNRFAKLCYSAFSDGNFAVNIDSNSCARTLWASGPWLTSDKITKWLKSPSPPETSVLHVVSYTFGILGINVDIIRVFPKVDHSGKDARIVLEQNIFCEKVTSNRDWTIDPMPVVFTVKFFTYAQKCQYLTFSSLLHENQKIQWQNITPSGNRTQAASDPKSNTILSTLTWHLLVRLRP